MSSAASKNLAMLLATKTYKGINSIGRAVRNIPRKIENVRKLKNERNVKMIEDNFGSMENYKKLQ